MLRGTAASAAEEAEKSIAGHSFLDSFDFTAIEEMDPSLAEGHRVVYDRECPFELRVLDEETNPHHCRIELSSENDLFFHYTQSVDEQQFKLMQENQKLMIDFNDYVHVVIRMLNQCIKEPHSYLAVFVMQRDGRARLDFIQNMEYKFVELLSG